MMTRLRLSIASFLVLLVTLSGMTQASEVRSAERTEAPSVTTHAIEIRDFVFSPRSIKVKTGDTITWTNFDIVPHTATANDSSWDSGTLEQGESFILTIAEDMELDYFCVFHPMMKASLTRKN